MEAKKAKLAELEKKEKAALEAKAKANKDSSSGIAAMLKTNAATSKKFSFLDRFTNNDD